MNSTLAKGLYEGLISDQSTFYAKSEIGKGVMVTTIPYGKVKLLYVAWDFEGKLANESDPVINPYLHMDKEGAFLTYAGFYVPKEKTLFAQWHFLSAMTCKDGRQSLLKHTKEELGFSILWVTDGLTAFNKECHDRLEDKLIDDATYVVTDKERETITRAYREYLMGIADVESALWNICMSLGFTSHLFNAVEDEFLDYCAQRITFDDLLYSHMGYFKELHTKRCEYERVSEQLLKDSKVITALEQSFADTVKPIIFSRKKDSFETGIPVIEIPVVVTFKDGLRLKTELLTLRRHICDRSPLYYTGDADKHYIEDIKTITAGQDLENLGCVIWENNQ